MKAVTMLEQKKEWVSSSITSIHPLLDDNYFICSAFNSKVNHSMCIAMDTQVIHELSISSLLLCPRFGDVLNTS